MPSSYPLSWPLPRAKITPRTPSITDFIRSILVASSPAVATKADLPRDIEQVANDGISWPEMEMSSAARRHQRSFSAVALSLSVVSRERVRREVRGGRRRLRGLETSTGV